MDSHFDRSEWWSELHLLLTGELLAGIIRDKAADEDDLNEFGEKLVTVRELYRAIRAENDEIALATGIDRAKIRMDRFVRIG